MTTKLEKLGFEVFIRRVVQGEEGTTIRGAQRHPTHRHTKLHLIKVDVDIGRRLKVQVST